MDPKKAKFYYGLILILVGIGVFFRIPEVASQIEQIEFFRQKMTAVKFCFYMLGVFLVIAGGLRVYKNH